ncbi:MAG TPA: glycosyltransferase [Pyrinomonadaceae bacterium]|jgi:glycosyltransferase involved in cell wall biosynthesis|nr:glycosyltransferase [Pyrinomonadaceae bacterium]
MKIAFLSETLPPAQNGQGVVLYRLLEGFGPDEYCLVSALAWGAGEGEARVAGQLPGKYYRLSPGFRLRRGHRFGLARAREGFNIPAGILQRARQLTRIMRRENCDAVVACTGDLLDLPAGYLASRRAKVPFYPYIFDHYSYREWRDPARKFWAKRLEPFLLKGATRVIVPNETLRDDLRRSYGVEAAVIHNSFDISPYESNGRPAPAVSEDKAEGEVRIVYTGDVYEAHYDAFRNLLAAITSLGRPGVKLHLYTERSPDELAAEGIRGPVVHRPRHALSEMPRIQMEADILFLPLAFNSPYPDLVRTSATTKLGEYLAARRPVLVHAPPDSFISWYFREHECGVVVDRLDTSALARGLARLLDDGALRERLGARGWERVRMDFSIQEARAKFVELVGRGRHAAPSV